MRIMAVMACLLLAACAGKPDTPIEGTTFCYEEHDGKWRITTVNCWDIRVPKKKPETE